MMDSPTSYQAMFLILVIYRHIGMTSSQHFETQTNKRIKEEFTFFNATSMSAIQCAAECAKNARCYSASYNNDEGECHLSTSVVTTSVGQDTLTMTSSWTAILRKRCSVGWFDVGQTCYYFDHRWMNYTEAKNFCKTLGGKLAEPQTNDTYEVLTTFLIGNEPLKSVYWIGLNNLDNNGTTFVWTSDAAVPTYTAWSDHNEPYNYIGFNCTMIAWYSDYKWTSYECHETMTSLCEI